MTLSEGELKIIGTPTTIREFHRRVLIKQIVLTFNEFVDNAESIGIQEVDLDKCLTMALEKYL